MTNTAQPGPSRITSEIDFGDPVSAARNLVRLQEKSGGATYQSLLHILADSPDPDSVVVLLSRLFEDPSRVAAATVTRDPILLRQICLIFAHSKWLGETLIQNVDLLRRFGRRREMERSLSQEEFREEFARFQARSSERDLSLSLARFRKREYVRILLRDVLGVAKLAEITEEISALADALLEEALLAANADLTRRHGSPRWADHQGRQNESRFAVLSLGKLGGNELNYSSDVDLLFLFDGGKEPSDAPISNREYFIQLAQRTTEVLSRRTQEGQVFRIDLRLRPQGHEGELAFGLPTAVKYYSGVAQDWELQAMIKARHSAGDVDLSKEFITAIASFVYRPNVNFAAIKTALQSRERIDRRGRKTTAKETQGRSIDVKLDRGGIRDIEFLVQCLQRVYGGEEGWLRSRGTLFALQKLHDKGHISGKDYHNLTKAYEFLRNLEHHLQLPHGQQLHQLPANESELKVLAKCLHSDETVVRSPADFVAEVRSKMNSVAEIYRGVVFQEETSQLSDSGGELQPDRDIPGTPEISHGQIMQRLELDAPQLLTQIAKADLSQYARRNLSRFLSAAATSSERYRAILASPRGLERALNVLECSEYLTDHLVRYPTDIDLLEKPFINEPDTSVARRVESSVDRQQTQTVLRQQFRRTLFRSSVRELFTSHNIWQLLAEYSDAADKALQDSLGIAGSPSGIAVMALGRLGSREFDVLSDADVLFVADESADQVECRRAAERTMALLTAYTRDGSAFPIDARLRPQGTQGELVTTCTRLAQYFSREARPWEAISYLRVRFVAGSRETGTQVVQSVREGIRVIAGRSSFAADLADMRRRLEDTDKYANLKTGPGGTFDMDFLLGRLQAEHSVWTPGNLSTRISSLQECGLLSAEHASELAENAAFLRLLEHYVRLVTARSRKWLPAGDHAQSCVARFLSGVFGNISVHAVGERLAAVLSRNREIYLQYPF